MGQGSPGKQNGGKCVGSHSCGSWQFQLLITERPREELILQLMSVGSWEAEFQLTQKTSVFTLNLPD